MRRWRSTRRGKRFVLFIGVLCALVTAACNVGAGEQRSGDQLVVGQIAEPKSLDPATVTAVNDFRILVNVYDGLLRYADDSLEVRPALATDWTISNDGTVYTFKLRKGVTFHDGTDFNAAAVKFNFDRMLVEGAPGSGTGPFPLAEQFFGSVKNVRVVDHYTVEFTLEEPTASFLPNLAYPTGLIVSPTAVKKYGDDFGRHPVGTGAFSYESWTPQQSVVVKANPDYWGGEPKTQTVVFRPLPDSSARIAALRSGDADLIVEVPASNFQQLKGQDDLSVEAKEGPHTWFLILNCQEPPFDDKRVRQAANYAIDKQAIVEDVLLGTGSVATGPIAPAFGDVYDDSIDGYEYNPDKAEQLLAEAGYSDGVDATFYVTSSGSGMLEPKAMAVAMQAQLEEVGIRTDIKTFEWNAYLDRVNAGLQGKADMAEMAWMTNAPLTLPTLTLRTDAWPDKGGFNSGYYSNPRVDRILNELSVETEQARRVELFAELQRIVVEDAPWVFVANGKMTAAMTDHLEGFELHPSYVLYLADAELR